MQEEIDIRSLIQNLKPTSEIVPIPLLDNQSKAPYVQAREQAHQRLVVELKARGHTNREIAKETGLNPATVRTTLNQDRAKPLLVRGIHQYAAEIDQKVSEVVMEGVLEGAKLLLDTVKDDKAKRSDRITAAQEFLNRRYGKPNQPVNRENDVDLNAMSIAEIAAELPTAETASTVAVPSGAALDLAEPKAETGTNK